MSTNPKISVTTSVKNFIRFPSFTVINFCQLARMGHNGRRHNPSGPVEGVWSRWFPYKRIISSAIEGFRLEPGFPEVGSRIVPYDWLDFVRAGYDSASGRIEMEWKKNTAGFELHIAVPVETDVILPDRTERVPADKHVLSV